MVVVVAVTVGNATGGKGRVLDNLRMYKVSGMGWRRGDEKF